MRRMIAITAVALLVAGCGDTSMERGVSGAGLGAAAGGAVGAITGQSWGSALGGAALGGAAGAAAGALTNENQVNLGKPLWKR